jgi:hypothetical protein
MHEDGDPSSGFAYPTRHFTIRSDHGGGKRREGHVQLIALCSNPPDQGAEAVLFAKFRRPRVFYFRLWWGFRRHDARSTGVFIIDCDVPHPPALCRR